MKSFFIAFFIIKSFWLSSQLQIDSIYSKITDNNVIAKTAKIDEDKIEFRKIITSSFRSKFSVNINQNSSQTGRMVLSTIAGPSMQMDSIDLGTINYNLGPDFSIHNATSKGNKIIINSDGLYHIEGLVKFNLGHNSNGISANSSLNLLCESPGMPTVTYPLSDHEVLNQNDFVIPFNYGKGIHFDLTVYFNKGGNFTLQTIFENLINYPYNSLSAGNGYISGYKISD